MESRSHYVHALRLRWLNPLYDPIAALVLRERRFRERLVRQLAPKAGQRILDIGCGTGTLALLIRQTSPGSKVIGIDGDPHILDIARKKAFGTDVEFHCGLSFALPYPAQSFDRVVCSLMLHHLTTAEKMRTFEAIKTVLVRDGEFHAVDWSRPSGIVMRAAFFGVRLIDGFATTRDNVEGRLGELMAGAGLTDVREVGCMSTMFGTLSFFTARAAD